MKPLLVGALLLSGCSAKHYSVCIATAGSSGCSVKQFTLSTASRLAGELAAARSGEDRAVWLQDRRKPMRPVPDLKKLRREMESETKDNKL